MSENDLLIYLPGYFVFSSVQSYRGSRFFSLYLGQLFDLF